MRRPPPGQSRTSRASLYSKSICQRGYNKANLRQGNESLDGKIPHRRSDQMKQSIVHIALVIRDYDEAIEFYTKTLHFTLVEDTYQPEQDKRWVVVSPPGSLGTTLLLARASKSEQEPFIGNQAGGRVFLFLGTDDFWRDYNEMISK